MTLLTWRQNDPFKNNSCGGSVGKKAETSRPKDFCRKKTVSFPTELCYRHSTMSGGKGEALASELAALSVNEASAPPEGDGEKPSAEPAEGADSGGKITGVVSWFNVAKGFGARRRLSSVARTFFSLARVRAARRPRARARGAGRDASSFLCRPMIVPDRSTRALARRRIRPRASLFHARHPRPTASDSHALAPSPSPVRRLRDARRRRRGRLRAPERRLQPGVPQLTESGAGGVRPRAHRRRAVQSRERACLSPSESRANASAKQIQICRCDPDSVAFSFFRLFV